MEPSDGVVKIATLLSIAEIIIVPVVLALVWCIRDLYDRYVKTLGALSQFREEVALKYSTHETVTRIETRLLAEIRSVGEKLDRIIERQGIGHGHD